MLVLELGTLSRYLTPRIRRTLWRFENPTDVPLLICDSDCDVTEIVRVCCTLTLCKWKAPARHVLSSECRVSRFHCWLQKSISTTVNHSRCHNGVNFVGTELQPERTISEREKPRAIEPNSKDDAQTRDFVSRHFDARMLIMDP